MARINIADLPLRPDVSTELSDEQLDGVAGGWGFSSYAASYSYSFAPWASMPLPPPAVLPVPPPSLLPIPPPSPAARTILRQSR